MVMSTWKRRCGLAKTRLRSTNSVCGGRSGRLKRSSTVYPSRGGTGQRVVGSSAGSRFGSAIGSAVTVIPPLNGILGPEYPPWPPLPTKVITSGDQVRRTQLFR